MSAKQPVAVDVLIQLPEWMDDVAEAERMHGRIQALMDFLSSAEAVTPQRIASALVQAYIGGCEHAHEVLQGDINEGAWRGDA